MKERPMLFSAPMVLALLAGTKTQTRRIIKWPAVPNNHDYDYEPFVVVDGIPKLRVNDGTGTLLEKDIHCSHGQSGDHIWVKETFALMDVQPYDDGKSDMVTLYRATYTYDPSQESIFFKWKPSIFMPRKLSRITLEIESIRVERLQDISEEDAQAEGVSLDRPDMSGTGKIAKWNYAHLWERINGVGSWDKNPWVWVIQFHKI